MGPKPKAKGKAKAKAKGKAKCKAKVTQAKSSWEKDSTGSESEPEVKKAVDDDKGVWDCNMSQSVSVLALATTSESCPSVRAKERAR